MLLLAVAIILFMVFYQKKMLQEQLRRQQLEIDHQIRMMEAVLESQEVERKRVAADLHDSIGGMLSAIRVGLITMGRQLPNPQAMEQPKQMLDDTIGSVRSISRELMPSTLERFGLVHALRELCDQVHATSMLPVTFHEHGHFNPDCITRNQQLMLFRIVQELVTNAVKHAHSTAIRVGMDVTDKIVLTVEDNGIGFNPQSIQHANVPGKGLGLFNIENRVRLLNARLVFGPAEGRGAKITLTSPL